MNRKVTAALLVSAAGLTNVAFTALGSVFDYPDVLKHPAAEVLTDFRANQGPVTAWFTVLALSAALFAPIAVGVGRLAPQNRFMRMAVPVGVGAAVVQVIGLARWPLLVPGFAHDAASNDPVEAEHGRDAFLTAHHVLGNAIGETGGYLLTAAWIALVLAALSPAYGRWFSAMGGVSAALIVTGVLSPLDLPGVDLANFAGYLLFSVWLIAFAVLLVLPQRLSRRRPVVVGGAA